jgi:hypothetical protein
MEYQKKQRTPEEIIKKQEKKEEIKEAIEYCKTMKSHLMVTIFNEETRQESEKYREQKLPKGSAIYCSSLPVAKTIPLEQNLLVLEMNNDTNEIIAVGVVRNRPNIEKYFVYDDKHNYYNRFVYLGKYRIQRKDMTEHEESVMKALDNLCFKGNYHMKRTQGIRSFPAIIIWRCRIVMNLVEFIENMIRKRMNKQMNT